MQILLLADQGYPNEAIASMLMIVNKQYIQLLVQVKLEELLIV